MEDYIEMIIDKIEAEDEEVYLVGGAVRDHLLGRQVNDYDLATSARPGKIKEIFSDYTTVDIGSDYGTIIVVDGGENIEITTFRKESDYDGRKPGRVEFSHSLEEDLKRRDFTINALAYKPSSGLIDKFNGVEDLNNKIVRSIGDPEQRIREDYLRMLRAIRFACQLKFSIDEDLSHTIKEYNYKIKEISHERIQEEFNKILLSDTPSDGIDLLQAHGLLEIICPDLENMYGFDQHSSFHNLDLYDHTMMTLDGTKAVLELRLAALFHDVGKPASFFLDENGEGRFYGHQAISAEICKDFLKKYKYPKNFSKRVIRLIERHMDNVNPYTPKSIRKLVKRMEGDLDLLFHLQEADVRATNQECNLENIQEGRKLALEVRQKNLPTGKKDLAIDGNDLINIGFEEGRQIGEFLDYLVDLVIDDNSLNTYNKLIEISKDYIGGKNNEIFWN